MNRSVVLKFSRMSKEVGFAALLIALSLTISSAAASAQGGLTINIDGSDSEWKVSGWVCPGKDPCQVPTTSNTAWLCCNTTRIPRECQLVWRDEEGDIEHVRFYLNQTGLYAYIYANYHANQDRVSISLTVSEYTLTITIGPGQKPGQFSAEYRLFKPGGGVTSGNLGSGDFVVAGGGGQALRGIEVRFEFWRISNDFTPPQSATYALKVVLYRIQGQNINADASGVCAQAGVCTDVVNLVVEGYKIKDSYYDVGSQRYPVPIPEPGVLVSAAAVVTALGAIAFAAGRRRA